MSKPVWLLTTILLPAPDPCTNLPLSLVPSAKAAGSIKSKPNKNMFGFKCEELERRINGYVFSGIYEVQL
jgi:hypothetical protein